MKDSNEITTIVYLYNYPDFVNIQKKVHFLIDVSISRNPKEENVDFVEKLSNGITYRSEKEHDFKSFKAYVLNHLIELNAKLN